MAKIISKREKTILYLTLGVIIFGIVFNLFLVSILKKNEDLNREINMVHTKLSRYMWLLSQKEVIEAKYAKYSSVLKSPQQEETTTVSVLSELENLAKATNIHIIDIRPQPLRHSGGLYKEIIIDLKTEGNAEDYLKFIYDIENSLFLLTIKKLQINVRPNATILEGIFSISQTLIPD